jgi:hypothetical protein
MLSTYAAPLGGCWREDTVVEPPRMVRHSGLYRNWWQSYALQLASKAPKLLGRVYGQDTITGELKRGRHTQIESFPARRCTAPSLREILVTLLR